MVNAVVLPLYFISGVFFPTDEAPAWLNDVANVFPIRHLAEALLHAFEPASKCRDRMGAPGRGGAVGGGGPGGRVLTFRWTPKGE